MVYLLDALGDSGEEFEKHKRTGRPMGDEFCIEKTEKLLGRELKKNKPGPKPKHDN